MTYSKSLFGTDGIRGESNKFPILPELALRVGQALGYLLKKRYKGHKAPMALIGKDTRLSGYMLEQALAGGLNSMGVWVQLTGPLPTPGIGFLARNMRAVAGIVISASHNGYKDNGIKIFNAQGFKISKAKEEEIQSLVFSNTLDKYLVNYSQVGRSRRIDDSAGRYIVHVKNNFPNDITLDGLHIVLDCAHGACYKVAPRIFEELGAEVSVIGNEPNGYNINDRIGALYPEKIQQMVLEKKADVGISVDGDGDRLIMSDEKGHLLNGDPILGICALSLHKKGLLAEKKVAITPMSNIGLETFLNKHSIQVERTDIGDRNIMEHMRKNNIVLGGEPSGHIIFLNQNTTGDACVAALNVLAVMISQNKKLSELHSNFTFMPQIQMSLKVKNRIAFTDLPGYKKLIQRIKKTNKVHVRYSGTEPLIRILVEGFDKNLIKEQAMQIHHLLEKAIYKQG